MSFAIDARTIGVQLSRTARTLLSQRAMNDLAREGLINGGDEWIATWLPRRFQRGYAELLGYRTSQHRDPWAKKDPQRWPETYDQRKRQWQGHDLPLVWTGRLRAEIFRNARVTATATRGAARGRIGFGRLAVGRAGLWRAPPRLVADTLLGGPGHRLPKAEADTVAAGFLAYVVAALGGVVARQKQPLPAPPVILDRRAERLAQHTAARRAAESQHATIGDRMRERRQQTLDRYAAWRQDAGGSSPVGQRAMTLTERIIRHRAQSLDSYRRRRHIINPRRRLRSRGAL